jgi:demethylmenaquinone methyltransferase/2-methoxy-6-polyprenyl-1,4-benzoquinol methylase
MPIFDHFDILAPLYDRLIRIPENDQLARVVGLPIAGRMLDAGGGTGRIAQQLVDRVGMMVISDISVNMLRQAHQKDGLCCAVGSETEKIPFADASFERVIVVDAYHHLLDQAQSLREFWRVLAPGGRLVIEEPDIRRFGVKLLALAEKLALFRSHFECAEKIAATLETFGAKTDVQRDGITVWIVGVK